MCSKAARGELDPSLLRAHMLWEHFWHLWDETLAGLRGNLPKTHPGIGVPTPGASPGANSSLTFARRMRVRRELEPKTSKLAVPPPVGHKSHSLAQQPSVTFIPVDIHMHSR